MTAPIQHNMPTGAYLPLLKRIVDIKETNIQFVDNYPTIYQRFGIKRDEMMVVMPQVMTCDILAGLDRLSYIDEDIDDPYEDKDTPSDQSKSKSTD